LEAKIVLKYKTSKIAIAIARAISPDNFSAPSNLYIKTFRKNTQVVTEMETKENLSTLIATIDDLLFCVSTAERTLRVIKEK